MRNKKFLYLKSIHSNVFQLFFVLFLFGVIVTNFGCTSAEKRAAKTPFTGACPEFGFFKDSFSRTNSIGEDVEYPLNPMDYIQENNIPRTSVFSSQGEYGKNLQFDENFDRIFVSVQTKSREVIKVSLRNFSLAPTIENMVRYESFLKQYQQICGEPLPEEKLVKIPYYKNFQKKIKKEKRDQFIDSLMGKPEIEKLKSSSILWEESKERTNFDYAFWNEKEHPNLFNKLSFKGNEFELKEKKNEWNKIRNSKGIRFQDITINFGEYNFSNKTLPVRFEKSYIHGSSWLVGGSGLSLPIISLKDGLFLSMSEEEAKKWKSVNPKLILFANYKPVLDTIKYSEFIDNGEKIILNPELSNIVLRKDPSLRFNMTEKVAEYKYLLLIPVKYILYDSDSELMLTNIK